MSLLQHVQLSCDMCTCIASLWGCAARTTDYKCYELVPATESPVKGLLLLWIDQYLIWEGILLARHYWRYVISVPIHYSYDLHSSFL